MKQRKQKVTESPLSKKCLEIILGSLLGDGSLKIHKHYKNARFSFRHSIVQKEYFFWKLKEMKEISSKNCWWIQKNDGGFSKNDKIRYQSLAKPSLTEIYDLVSKRGKFKIKRKWLNLLTPLSLAIWWMDDGSIIGSGRKGVFCTDSFSRKEQLILSQYLNKVWGIKVKVGEKKKNSGVYRLWIYSPEHMKKFLRIILPYIPENMIYKVLILYKNPLFQQRWISEVVKLTGFSQEIVLNNLKEKKKKWKQFRE